MKRRLTMRKTLGWTMGMALSLVIASVASAGNEHLSSCDVCTCQDGAVICIGVENHGEVLEEQGVCGGACSSIGSSFESRDHFELSCSDLPICDHAEAPAASPLWLSAGALALVGIGGLGVRRARRRPSL
jgi:MYXO-CTERM domain-containing protein